MKFDLSQATKAVHAMVTGFLDRVPYICVGIIVFFVFYFFGRVVRHTSYQLADRAHRHSNLGLVVGRLAQGLLILVGMLVAMVIAIPGFSPGQLFSILGIGSVAIGFAFRDILQNFLAGILLLLGQPFRIGDQIVAEDIEGTVEDIQTRATFIKTYDGRRIVVPNSNLFTGLVTVNTAFMTRRLEHQVGISYADDVERACDILEVVMREAPSVLNEPEPEAFMVDFGASSLDIRMQWWISSPYQKDVLFSKGEVLRKAKIALDEAGITIPFPIRTLDFSMMPTERPEARGMAREVEKEGVSISPSPF